MRPFAAAVLRALREAEAPLTSADLSAASGYARTSVYEGLRLLRESGVRVFSVEFSSGRGRRKLHTLDPIQAEQLQARADAEKAEIAEARSRRQRGIREAQDARRLQRVLKARAKAALDPEAVYARARAQYGPESSPWHNYCAAHYERRAKTLGPERIRGLHDQFKKRQR